MGPLAYIPQAVLGVAQSAIAYNQLQKLRNQPLPKYDTSQASKNVAMYEQRFREGMSADEIAAMDRQFASSQAGFYRQAADNSRGQLSNFLGRVSALDRARYATQLGSAMAQERRAAMSGLAGARQGLESQLNAQTRFEQQRRMQEEQALGQAIQSGLYNLGNAATFGLYGLGKKTTEDVVTEPTEPTATKRQVPQINVGGTDLYRDYLQQQSAIAAIPEGTTTGYYNSFSPDFGMNQNQVLYNPLAVPPAPAPSFIPTRNIGSARLKSFNTPANF